MNALRFPVSDFGVQISHLVSLRVSLRRIAAAMRRPRAPLLVAPATGLVRLTDRP